MINSGELVVENPTEFAVRAAFIVRLALCVEVPIAVPEIASLCLIEPAVDEVPREVPVRRSLTDREPAVVAEPVVVPVSLTPP